MTSVSHEAPSQRNLGHGQQPRAGQSAPAAWTTLPEFRSFTSPQNLALLRSLCLQRIGGAIGDDNLLAVMHEQGFLFLDKDGDATYGPATPDQVQRQVQRMNARVIARLEMLYLSDRSAQRQWRRDAHVTQGMTNQDQAMTQYQEDHQVESRWLDD